MLVYWGWVTSLANDFKQVLIGKEEEPGEVESLLLEELIEVLFNILEQSLHAYKGFQERVFFLAMRKDECLVALLLFVNASHFGLELAIHFNEPTVFLWQ